MLKNYIKQNYFQNNQISFVFISRLKSLPNPLDFLNPQIFEVVYNLDLSALSGSNAQFPYS